MAAIAEAGTGSVLRGRRSDSRVSGGAAPAREPEEQPDPLTGLLARSLERQVSAAERTADRMDDLGGKIDRMGDRIASEMRHGMSQQIRIVGGLVALAIILLAGVAGVQFSGRLDHRGGVGVETTLSDSVSGRGAGGSGR